MRTNGNTFSDRNPARNKVMGNDQSAKSEYRNYFQRNQTLDRAKKKWMVEVYVRFPFLARIYREVQRLPQGASVLDLGAGEGHFLRVAMRLRPDVKFFAADLTNALPQPEFAQVPFSEIDLDAGAELQDEGAYDLIVCQHVIEHLRTPGAVFKQARRLLKAGGVLYVECPDVRWTLLPHVPFVTGREGGFNFWDDPTHVRPFSRPSLSRLAAMHDLEVTDAFYVRKFGHLLALPLALFSRNDDYKIAVLHVLLGLWCGVLARKAA